MRRPHVASAGSFRKRLRKKQTGPRPRSVSAKPPVARNDELRSAAREPMRCAFGAVRVGALLGRVRLHLQTDRFLAVHRGDAPWEEACREAGLALAEIVARMAEAEMGAPLAPRHALERRALGAPLALQHTQDEPPKRSAGLPRAAKGLQPGPALPEEIPPGCTPSHLSENERWGTRKTGTVTLARYSAELERSAQ